jgi:hypothetical protein
MDGVKQQDSTPQNDSNLEWVGTFTRLRSCIVPAEITEPPKISGGENHKYDKLDKLV